jgi:rhodanese-related sulfurtransferase
MVSRITSWAVILLAWTVLVSCLSLGDIKNVTAEELQKMMSGGTTVVVDNRTDFEFRQGRIPGSLNISQERFSVIEMLLPPDKDTLMIFYCRGYG